MFLRDLFMRLTGWKRVTRSKGNQKWVIWYKPLKHRAGYSDYDYAGAINNAVRAMTNKPKRFNGRAVIRFEEYFSTGRPGYGTRRIRYTIGN